MITERCYLCLGNNDSKVQVKEECLPVAAFGRLSSDRLKVVTVGLNPALNEFYSGGHSKPKEQRLALLSDYGVTARTDLTDADVHDAQVRRFDYFTDLRRPWHPYFEKLECFLNRANPAWSYVTGTAAHVDLVACATKDRWSNLSGSCQKAMLANCRPHFLAALASLPDETLLLFDGARVTAEIQNAGLCIKETVTQLINIQRDSGRIGTVQVEKKKFEFRGWSAPAGSLTPPRRHELAFWLAGTLRPGNATA